MWADNVSESNAISAQIFKPLADIFNIEHDKLDLLDMGYFYSLGINFDKKEDAENCNQQFKNFEIILSDQTFLETSLNIYTEKAVDDFLLKQHRKEKFQTQIFPKGLEYLVGDKKLASKPYFYELRNKLYSFLLSLEIEFNYAFFEFEGADHFLDDNIIETLNKYGIGEVVNGDPNAATIAGFDSEYYSSKRFYDGLVLNNKVFANLDDVANFVEFKNGYMWLPLENKE